MPNLTPPTVIDNHITRLPLAPETPLNYIGQAAVRCSEEVAAMIMLWGKPVLGEEVHSDVLTGARRPGPPYAPAGDDCMVARSIACPKLGPFP